MKAKIVTMLLLSAGLLVVLTACSTDDAVYDGQGQGKVRTGKYTEVWTVVIEPEYVLGGDFWGGYTSIFPVMEATDDAGNRTATFMMNQIKGFDFEEGYRYKLQIEAEDVLASQEEKGIYIADASRYEFTLQRVLNKEYVGIRQEGKRDLEMDVRMVRVCSENDYDSWQYMLLCGTVVGSDETILMAVHEIYGLDNSWIYQEYTVDGTVKDYRVRMKVSITPSDKPVYGQIKRRIRLQEIVSKERVEGDSVIYMNRDEAGQMVYGI